MVTNTTENDNLMLACELKIAQTVGFGETELHASSAKYAASTAGHLSQIEAGHLKQKK